MLENIAVLGDGDAMLDLANYYHITSNRGVWGAKSLYWLKRSAKQEQPEALYLLGLAYQKGDGVARNNSLAKQYLKKAEALEFALAEMELKKMKGDDSLSADNSELPDKITAEAEVKVE